MIANVGDQRSRRQLPTEFSSHSRIDENRAVLLAAATRMRPSFPEFDPLAKALNIRSGRMISGIRVETRRELFGEMGYVRTNPVRPGLVSAAEDCRGPERSIR